MELSCGTTARQSLRRHSEVLTVEYKLNPLAPAAGDLEAIGTVLRPGRTLTVCRLEVFAHVDGQRKLAAVGQQTLVSVAADNQT